MFTPTSVHGRHPLLRPWSPPPLLTDRVRHRWLCIGLGTRANLRQRSRCLPPLFASSPLFSTTHITHSFPSIFFPTLLPNASYQHNIPSYGGKSASSSHYVPYHVIHLSTLMAADEHHNPNLPNDNDYCYHSTTLSRRDVQ